MQITKTYTANKGWPAKFKGIVLTWLNFTTVAEAISAGDFKDEETLVTAAYRDLNIARGHAASASANEKDADGNAVGEKLTVAEIQEIARGRNYAKGISKRSASGGLKAKDAVKAGRRTKEIASAAAADPKKLAALRAAGFTDADLAEMGVSTTAAAPAPAKR